MMQSCGNVGELAGWEGDAHVSPAAQEEGMASVCLS